MPVIPLASLVVETYYPASFHDPGKSVFERVGARGCRLGQPPYHHLDQLIGPWHIAESNNQLSLAHCVGNFDNIFLLEQAGLDRG